jgi:4-diphosphocytidyl-2-C-methyl-D-erythritol kinase
MSDVSFSLPSFAKINWYLRIIGKRDDGYHELCTVFQTVSLFDEIHFSESDDLVLSCSDVLIPNDENNLIIRAANKLRNRFGITKGAKILLEKRIPAPGGLGGGSSNAAIALLGLARLWKLATEPDELLKLAESLGSDVPFFLKGGTAIGTGRGTEIEQVQDIVENYMIVVSPGVDVSTCKAFGFLAAPSLTKSESKSILQICRLEARELKLRQSGLKNDFENAVFKIEPEIKRVKKKLFDLGAKQVLMSGSGASVFAVFDGKEKLQSAIDVLKFEETWRVFRVKTVSRGDYLESLSLVQKFLQ